VSNNINLEAFAVTEFSEIFLGRQQRQDVPIYLQGVLVVS